MTKNNLKVVKTDNKKQQELKEKNKSLEAAISPKVELSKFMDLSHQAKLPWHYKSLLKLKKLVEYVLL